MTCLQHCQMNHKQRIVNSQLRSVETRDNGVLLQFIYSANLAATRAGHVCALGAISFLFTHQISLEISIISTRSHSISIKHYKKEAGPFVHAACA